MPRYHISPATGRPNICRAEQECPIGGAHYENKVEARKGFENAQTSSLPEPARKTSKAVDEPELETLEDPELEEIEDPDLWVEVTLREAGEEYSPWDDNDEDDEIQKPKAYSWD